MEVKVEHHNSLETDATSAVRLSSVTEGIDVGLDRGDIYLVHLSALSQQLGVMNPLRTRADFLSSQEQIVRVGEALNKRECETASVMWWVREKNGKAKTTYVIMRVWHGVERTNCQRESIQDIKIGMICRLDNATQ